jgi:hypothetical protein
MPYVSAPLADAPDGCFTQLVRAAKQRRLVVYLGAGISMSPPSCGPTGPAVADALRPFVARMVNAHDDDLDGLTLEELAQKVADGASERLAELRERAAVAFDFRGIAPNFGHEAAAILLREGLVQLISVNWDCGIERAGARAGVDIQGVADLAESVQLSHSLPLYKVHGCATRPWTLAITQDDVDRPQSWAVARTQGALVGGVVVFVGLGTIGVYVAEPFAELVATWTLQAATVTIVDPKLSEAWCEALGQDEARKVHVARSADAFLDELLRAVLLDALDSVELVARDLAQREKWAEKMLEGFSALRIGLDSIPAYGTLRWWRDGVVETQAGTPFITELAGQKSLMTVAQLAGLDGGEIEVAGVRGRQTVATAQRYFEIVCRPRDHVSRVQTVARDRVETRRTEGAYATNKPVTVVVADAMGEFPSDAAPADIAGGGEDGADILSGVEASAIRFVAAEDGVAGRLAP